MCGGEGAHWTRRLPAALLRRPTLSLCLQAPHGRPASLRPSSSPRTRAPQANNTHRVLPACASPTHPHAHQMWDEACEFEGELDRFCHNLSKFEAATDGESRLGVCGSVPLCQLVACMHARLHPAASPAPNARPARPACPAYAPTPHRRVPDAPGAHPARAPATRLVSARAARTCTRQIPRDCEQHAGSRAASAPGLAVAH